jgi:threonine/homoserine/homoserine lactone efflux protein
MIKIVQYTADFIWIFGGLFLTLLGFKVIKKKAAVAENQAKRERQEKNYKLMKVLGIVFMVCGIFKLIILIFDL